MKKLQEQTTSQRINTILEQKIPINLHQNPEILRKARLTLYIASITIVAGCLYAPMFLWLYGSFTLALVCVGGSVQAWMTFPLLRNTRSLSVAGHNIALTFFWVMLTFIITTGGVDSTGTFPWIAATPVIGVLLIDKRAGLFWLICVIITTSMIIILQMLGIALPVLYDAGKRSLLILSCLPGGFLILYLFTNLLETSKDLALNIAAESRVAVEQALANARRLAEEVVREKQNAEMLAQKTEEQRAYLASSIESMLLYIERFASGDLTVQLNVSLSSSHDDIEALRQGINVSISNVHAIVQAAFESIADTFLLGKDIGESTHSLAMGVQEQRGRVLSITAAIEQIIQTIEKTSEHASQAAFEASQTSDEARNGGEIIARTITGMTTLVQTIEQSTRIVENLGKTSEAVAEMAQSIEEIADQTNLLALNAAIEAARAGEQGRGFSVVADEVRKLAERTQKATKTITSMLMVIQAEITNAITIMHSGKQNVVENNQAAAQAFEVFQHIIEQTSIVSDAISQAAAVSSQQHEASAEIRSSIDYINTFTLQTASAIQQIAANIEELNTCMSSLHQDIGRFHIGVTKHQTNGHHKLLH